MEPEQEYDRRSSSNSKIHYLHSADKKSSKSIKNSAIKSKNSNREEASGSNLVAVNDFIKNSLQDLFIVQKIFYNIDIQTTKNNLFN